MVGKVKQTKNLPVSENVDEIYEIAKKRDLD